MSDESLERARPLCLGLPGTYRVVAPKQLVDRLGDR